MTDQRWTLGAICSVGHDEATSAILAGIEEEGWHQLELPSWIRTAAARKVAGYLDRLLDVPLEDILCGAWNTYRKYYKYTDTKNYPADKEYEEKEGKFSVDTRNTPKVEIQLNGQTILPVTFPITLALEFSGAVIVIQNRRFQAVKPGTCTLTGKLCCEKAILKEYKSHEVTLPGVIRFGAGVPIRPGGR